MVFRIKSRRNVYFVQVSDKDAERVSSYARFNGEKRVKECRSDKRDRDGHLVRTVDYAAPLGSWHIVWQKEKITAVATSVNIGSRLGTKFRHRTKQVKLHEYVVGEIPHCKEIRFRDGDPLNNTRENLALYQAYVTEKLDYATKGRAKTDICIGCINDKTCRRVPTRKKTF